MNQFDRVRAGSGGTLSGRSVLVSIPADPSQIGDKAVKAAVELYHKVRSQSDAMQKALTAAQGEYRKAEVHQQELASQGDLLGGEEAMAKAREALADAQRRTELARSAIEPAIDRYVDALKSANNWKVQLRESAEDFARRAVDTAGAAAEAARAAEMNRRMLAVVSDPYSAQNRDKPLTVEAAADEFVAVVKKVGGIRDE